MGCRPAVDLHLPSLAYGQGRNGPVEHQRMECWSQPSVPAYANRNHADSPSPRPARLPFRVAEFQSLPPCRCPVRVERHKNLKDDPYFVLGFGFGLFDRIALNAIPYLL